MSKVGREQNMVWNRQILAVGALFWGLASVTGVAQQLTATQAYFDEPRQLSYFESCGSLLDPTGTGGSGAVELCSAVRPVACDDSGCDLSVVPDFDTACTAACQTSCP